MSRSSRREPSGRRRGQTEPLAALVALFAVCAGVSLYATALGGSIPTADRDLSAPTLDRVHDAGSRAGVVHPRTLSTAVDAGPDGRGVNATLSADGRRWSVGPTPPARADRASRTVSVRLGPGRIAPGRLTVRVWG